MGSALRGVAIPPFWGMGHNTFGPNPTKWFVIHTIGDPHYKIVGVPSSGWDQGFQERNFTKVWGVNTQRV